MPLDPTGTEYQQQGVPGGPSPLPTPEDFQRAQGYASPSQGYAPTPAYAPPPPPSPTYYPYATPGTLPPPPRKNRTGLVVAIIAIVIIICLCCSCIGLYILGVISDNPGISSPYYSAPDPLEGQDF